MATINFNLERTFIKGLPKAEVDQMRTSRKIDPKLLYDKEVAINLMINVGGKLYKIGSEEKIKPKFWDQTTKQARKNYPGAFELNMVLDRLKNSVIRELRNAQLSQPRMDVEQVRELIKNTVRGLQPDMRSIDLFTAYNEFLEEKALQVKPLTIKKYKTLLKTLKEYAKVKGKKLCFHNINMEFDRDFKNYLIHDKGFMNNYLDKLFDNVRVFMSWSVERQYTSNEDFKKFITKRDETDIVYLTEFQLDAMYNLDLSTNKSLELVRDMFIFQANTGQRYSDIINLKFSDIHTMVWGKEWHLYQIKGNKSKKITIPLTEKAKDILLKYLHRESTFPKIFPAFTNVTSNRYLKQIAKMTECCDTPITIVQYNGKRRVETQKCLWQFVTTHTARRSFVTISLQNGMRPEVAMQVTGHQDFKVMKKYLKITQNVVQTELLKAWN